MMPAKQSTVEVRLSVYHYTAIRDQNYPCASLSLKVNLPFAQLRSAMQVDLDYLYPPSI